MLPLQMQIIFCNNRQHATDVFKPEMYLWKNAHCLVAAVLCQLFLALSLMSPYGVLHQLSTQVLRGQHQPDLFEGRSVQLFFRFQCEA